MRPGEGTDTIVFVLIGVGGCVAMLGAGYLGARIAMRRRPSRDAPIVRTS